MANNLMLIKALRTCRTFQTSSSVFTAARAKEQIKPLKPKETWQYTASSSLSQKKINKRTHDLINKKQNEDS